MAKANIEEKLSEHSRRLTMIEDIFIPMARSALEILVGKDGKPGMAEEMRQVMGEIQRMRLEIQRMTDSQNKNHDVTIAGIKTTAETKIAIINSATVILTAVTTWLLSQ